MRTNLRWAILMMPLILLVPKMTFGDESGQWRLGQVIETMTIADQNNTTFSIDEKVKLLIVARDMAASKLVAATLESTPQPQLNEKGIAYLADVSGMPGLVFKFAALPKMRKLPYSILLDREGTLTERAPLKEKQVTLVGLDKKKVISINFYSSPQELRKALTL